MINHVTCSFDDANKYTVISFYDVDHNMIWYLKNLISLITIRYVMTGNDITGHKSHSLSVRTQRDRIGEFHGHMQFVSAILQHFPSKLKYLFELLCTSFGFSIKCYNMSNINAFSYSWHMGAFSINYGVINYSGNVLQSGFRGLSVWRFLLSFSEPFALTRQI